MPTSTDTAHRAGRQRLRSPLAVPGELHDAGSGPAEETGSAVPAALTAPRAVTLTDFHDYLRTTNNRDGRPYEAGTINAYLSPAKTLDAWMSANGFDGDFTAADTALLNRFFRDYYDSHGQGGTHTLQRNLIQLFNFLQREHGHPTPYTTTLNRYAEVKGCPKTLSAGFIDDLLDVTGGGKARDFETARDHAIIRILRSEGIRRQELLSMVMHTLPADLIKNPVFRLVPLKGARAAGEGRLVMLAPGEVHVGVTGRDVKGRLRGAAQVYLRPGRGGDDVPAAHVVVPASERDRLAAPQLPDDVQELPGPLVPGLLAEVVAEPLLLHVVAAGDHVQQQAATGYPLVGNGHVSGQGRRHQPWAERDQELEPLGDRGECRGHNPCVLTPGAGRGERPGKAELLRGSGYLADVADVRRPFGPAVGHPAACGTDRVAQTQVGPGVTVGGQEPVQNDPHGGLPPSVSGFLTTMRRRRLDRPIRIADGVITYSYHFDRKTSINLWRGSLTCGSNNWSTSPWSPG